MFRSFLLKIISGIGVLFIIGLLFGALGRSIVFNGSSNARVDILGADISDVPVPMYKDEQYNLSKTIKERAEKFSVPAGAGTVGAAIVEKNSAKNFKKVLVFQAAAEESTARRAATEEGAARTAPDYATRQSPAPAGADDSGAIDFLDCDFQMPKTPVFSGRPIKNSLVFSVKPDSPMHIALFFENTGNVPWFSSKSKCANGPYVNLGTTRERDRASVLYASGSSGENGWSANNRIVMQTPRVEPGQIGVFDFTSLTPNIPDIYREFFALVAEGKTWINDSGMMIDFYVGDSRYSPEDSEKLSLYLIRSGRFGELDLNAEKSVEINLSEQKMYLRLGENLIRVFRVSTGAAATPTPKGNFKIERKQRVRIAGGDILYIMPKWQTIYKGVGMHALPSLGNAKLRAKIRALGPDEDSPVKWFKNDALWTEAVEHIGIPVSHGCIRLLPDDAAFAFDFTEIGTPVAIRS